MKVSIFNIKGDLLEQYTWKYELPKIGDHIWINSKQISGIVTGRTFDLSGIIYIIIDIIENND